jgi:hypothetical protein
MASSRSQEPLNKGRHVGGDIDQATPQPGILTAICLQK